MKRVLVTGVGGPAGMAVLQSLKGEYWTLGVDMNKLAGGFTYADAYSIVPPGNSAEYLPEIVRLCDEADIDVVIPTVDEEVSELAKLADHNGSINASILLPSWSTVDEARDKLLGVASFGVPTPNSCLLADFHRQVSYPVVVKRRTGRGGRDLKVVHGGVELRALKRQLNASDFIVQHYIEGIVVLAQGLAHSGRLLRSCLTAKLKANELRQGTATSAITVKDPEVAKMLETVVKQSNWTGAIGCEFIVNKRFQKRSKYWLIDVNPRICGQSHLATLAGMNLAKGLVELSLGERLSIPDDYQEGVTFVRSWRDEVLKAPLSRGEPVLPLSSY